MNRWLTYFLLILIILSCKKNDDKDTTNSSDNKISINDFSDDADTLSIYFYPFLDISISGSHYPKYVLKVFSQSSFILSDSSYDGTFRIPVDQVYTYYGYWFLRFEVYGGQSDQSFSEIKQNGTFIRKREVVIEFFNDVRIPEPVFTEKNGTLEGKIDSLPFVKTLAVYKLYNFSGDLVRVDSSLLSDNNEFIFTDNSYVGERASYTLKGYMLTDSAGYSQIGSTSIIKPIEITPHIITIDENGWPVITWNKNHYHQNFSKYRIRKSKGYSSSVILKEITDINDTVLSDIDLGFPGSTNIYVTHLPKNNIEYIDNNLELEYFGHMVKYYPGIPIRPFDYSGFKSPLGDDFYLYPTDGKYIYRYSDSDFQMTDSILCENGRFRVSANNKFVMTYRYGKYYLYNTSDGLSIFQAANNSNFLNSFDVSDAGTIAVIHVNDDLKLYDVIHNQLLGTLPMGSSTVNSCQISSTGEYLHVHTNGAYNRIFRYYQGTFTEVLDSDYYSGSLLKFIPDQPDKILLVHNGKCKILNLVTGIFEITTNLDYSFSTLDVDFNDNLIVTADDYFFKIYDIYTGSVIKTITRNIDYSILNATYLHGRTLFNADGRRLTF